MKRILIMLITSVLALSVLVSCGENKKAENKTGAAREKVVDDKIDINKLVTIKEAVNKEGVSPNGEKVKYIYEIPVINIDKPGAHKINDMFLNLEKGEENRIGNRQSMTLLVKSKAFLNNGIISVVMEIKKPGPGGIHAVNYDMESDKEISTKELLEKYKFDPQKLIAGINRIESEKGQGFMGIDDFVYTVLDYNMYNGLKSPEGIENRTKEEKERYVIENIDKIQAYINRDCRFVFIHRAELEDEELVVE